VSPGSRGPVIIDTGVFGARLTPQGQSLASAYRPLLEGRPAVISFITVAELRYGAKLAGWGTARLVRLDHELSGAETVWPGPNLTETYATVRAWCARNGHGLGGKDHEADRWVAASAIWLAIPLVAHDAIFANVEGLTLLTKLGLYAETNIGSAVPVMPGGTGSAGAAG
jgi:predicted nucleic acid-binding protein